MFEQPTIPGTYADKFANSGPRGERKCEEQAAKKAEESVQPLAEKNEDPETDKKSNAATAGGVGGSDGPSDVASDTATVGGNTYYQKDPIKCFLHRKTPKDTDQTQKPESSS